MGRFGENTREARLRWFVCTDYAYTGEPLLRPPSESHWCGCIRLRGMVVRERLDYYITCALRNTRIHIQQCITVSFTRKMAFDVYRWSLQTAGNATTNPLQCIQARPHSSPFYTEQHIKLPAFPKIMIQKTSTHRLPLSPSFYFHFSLYPLRPLESASCRL